MKAENAANETILSFFNFYVQLPLLHLEVFNEISSALMQINSVFLEQIWLFHSGEIY